MNVNLDTFFDKIVADVIAKENEKIKDIRDKAEAEIIALASNFKTRIENAMVVKITLLIQSGVITLAEGKEIAKKYEIEDSVITSASAIKYEPAQAYYDDGCGHRTLVPIKRNTK